MEQQLIELRNLNSKIVDRVLYLLKFASCDRVFQDTLINYLRLIKIKRDVTKFNMLLEKTELHLLKKSHFNFVIHNIPEYGIVSSTHKSERIGYVHIYDTLEQFGDVNTFDIVRGTAYVKFDDPSVGKYAHNTINNMMMGNQIIRTVAV
jgi:hypothetical protein